MLTKIALSKLSVISSKTDEKIALVKDFLCHSTCGVRNGNLLKTCVSEIYIK